MKRHVPLSEHPVAERGSYRTASGDTPEPPPAGGSRHVDPELGFDPDSPDLADPQVDPPHPPHAPEDGPDPRNQRRVPDDRYPPYSPS
ncbi:hypothetical protein JVX91_22590 [Pseudomonas sp. PDNC002]|uniref:DUF6021 family protein n=1 Tax=Pseudomonas sp. PDNC002 TaxID=2811422 RepID=UPI001962947F|nr:DUF6021 family protein [Pseudomonas sp. PDNC002]QRY82549.1 hypothetical protein JVX91_22590 [Pseudomonas sp. PDNC002]